MTNISNLTKLKLTPTLPISKQTLIPSKRIKMTLKRTIKDNGDGSLKTMQRTLITLSQSKQTLRTLAQTLKLSKKSNGYMVQRLKS